MEEPTKDKIEYEVIKDYPKSPFILGEVLKLEDGFRSELTYSYYTDYGKEFMYKSEFDEYPHLFKRL